MAEFWNPTPRLRARRASRTAGYASFRRWLSCTEAPTPAIAAHLPACRPLPGGLFIRAILRAPPESLSTFPQMCLWIKASRRVALEMRTAPAMESRLSHKRHSRRGAVAVRGCYGADARAADGAGRACRGRHRGCHAAGRPARRDRVYRSVAMVAELMRKNLARGGRGGLRGQ